MDPDLIDALDAVAHAETVREGKLKEEMEEDMWEDTVKVR